MYIYIYLITQRFGTIYEHKVYDHQKHFTEKESKSEEVK